MAAPEERPPPEGSGSGLDLRSSPARNPNISPELPFSQGKGDRGPGDGSGVTQRHALVTTRNDLKRDVTQAERGERFANANERTRTHANGDRTTSNARLIVGVDIGRTGAVALLTADGDLMNVVDLPTLDDGPKGRPAVNAVLLAEMLRSWAPARAYVEYVGARPGEAASGAFAFGRCRGVVEGVLGAHGVPVKMLTPPTWKRAVGIPPGREGAKDAARSEAIRRWPAMAEKFGRVRDDGRAEAALIGVAGMLREGRQ